MQSLLAGFALEQSFTGRFHPPELEDDDEDDPPELDDEVLPELDDDDDDDDAPLLLVLVLAPPSPMPAAVRPPHAGSADTATAPAAPIPTTEKNKRFMKPPTSTG